MDGHESAHVNIQAAKELVRSNGWQLPQDRSNQIAEEVWQAYGRIRPVVHFTPLEASPWLASLPSSSSSSGVKTDGVGNVYLKMESEQRTGSFKARGCVNKVLSLNEQQLRSGLVTSSSGNHALAFLYACSKLPAVTAPRSKIYLPGTASSYKVSRIQAQAQAAGADVLMMGNDCIDAENAAAKDAEDGGAVYVSPYNDMQVAAGQGTIAIELLMSLQAADLDAVFISVGGGGLISGMGALLKSAAPTLKIIACQPANSDVMRRCVEAGKVIEHESQYTLSDGTAGGVEVGAITLGPCMTYVDDWVTVSEQEISAAMLGMLENHSKLIEGAAGVAIAGYLAYAHSPLSPLKGKNVAIVVCGGNVAVQTLKAVIP